MFMASLSSQEGERMGLELLPGPHCLREWHVYVAGHLAFHFNTSVHVYHLDI